MTHVVLERACAEHAGRTVVGPLDLAVAERSWTLVVGPSGAGKTTLLRLVAGLDVPSAGRVLLGGRVASADRRIAIPPEAREIGFVFQGAGAGLWPHLSVRATLDFVLSCRRVRRSERGARADEVLELVELRGLDARRPGELSGGEAQRLALARALVTRPRLLLLDEPLAALDAPLRAGVLRALAELRRRFAPTIVHVTHDPREVEPHADRTVALEGGVVRAPAVERVS